MLWKRAGAYHAICVLLLAFVAGRVAIWLREPIFRAPDTASYAGGLPYRSIGEVLSFTGHSPRLWGTPLFYAAFSGDEARVAAQAAVGTVAWALLAVVLSGCLCAGAIRVLAAAVLVLGLTPQVTNWDSAVLSESLSISMGVLTLALLIRFLRGGGRTASVALVCLTASAFWFRRRRLLVGVALGLGVAAVAASLVDVNISAGDYSRFGIQEAVFLRVAIVVLAVAGIDALVERLRPTPAAEPAGQPATEEHDEARRPRRRIQEKLPAIPT